MQVSIFGRLDFAGTDLSWPGVKCDRLALNKTGGLLFASFLADTGIIKGIRGLLNSEKRAFISAKGLAVASPNGNPRTPDSIGKVDGGYTVEAHRLPYGLAHAFVYSKTPGLMLGRSNAHLWAKLTDPAFTTPILPEWIDYVAKTLRKRERLVDAQTYRCECSVLLATVADVDAVVSEGIKAGKLVIPPKPALHRVA